MTLEERIQVLSREQLCDLVLQFSAKTKAMKIELRNAGIENSVDLRLQNKKLSDNNEMLKQQLFSVVSGRTQHIEDESTIKLVLTQIICGSLNDTITAHGAITRNFANSAAKRVAGTVLSAMKHCKNLYQE